MAGATEPSEVCSDCGHGKDLHAIWGLKAGCYACSTCPMWNPPASLGERRARQTHAGEDTTDESEWTIRQWNGTRWVDLEVVRGDAARDAALRG